MITVGVIVVTSCPDICTADKCRELEERISALEIALELLEAAFNVHVNQNIPEAHDYQPDVDVALAVDSDANTLKVFVSVDGKNDSETVSLPTNEPEVDVSLAVDSDANTLKVFVAVGDKNDSETVSLPTNEPEVDVSLAVDSDANTLKVFVAVGDKNDSETVSLPTNEPEVDVSLAVDSDANTLKVFVAVGDKNDSETVSLPTNEPEVDVSLAVDSDANTLKVFVAVGDKNDSETVTLPEFNPDLDVNVDVDPLGFLTVEVKLDDKSASDSVLLPEIDLNKLIDLINELKDFFKDLIRELFNELLEEIFDLIRDWLLQNFDSSKFCTIDECGSLRQDLNLLEASFEVHTGQDIPTAHDYDPSLPEIDDGGGGINDCEISLTLEENILTANLIVGQCLSFDSVNIMQFSEITVEKVLCNDGVIESSFIPVSVIKGTEAAEMAAFEERAKIRKAQCELELAEVVSLVASDRFINQISNRQLILHFVDLDNYPKRKRNSSYRPVQIPLPLDEYDWQNDFEPLRWIQGNQYAELRFQGQFVPVSGWFRDRAAAEAYFDAILNLTTAVEDNRVIPIHTQPKTNIPVQTTRPYRAFIVHLGSDGKAVCDTKYVPIEPE
jgi:alpha-L-arabinofuranosidase